MKASAPSFIQGDKVLLVGRPPGAATLPTAPVAIHADGIVTALRAAELNRICVALLFYDFWEGTPLDLVTNPLWRTGELDTVVLLPRSASKVANRFLRCRCHVVEEPTTSAELDTLVRRFHAAFTQTQVSDLIGMFCSEFGLSPRERQLLSLAVQGFNNDEVASSMGCARATISTHWNRIFRKTVCTSQRDVFARLVHMSCAGRTQLRLRPVPAPAVHYFET